MPGRDIGRESTSGPLLTLRSESPNKLSPPCADSKYWRRLGSRGVLLQRCLDGPVAVPGLLPGWAPDQRSADAGYGMRPSVGIRKPIKKRIGQRVYECPAPSLCIASRPMGGEDTGAACG